MRWATNPKAQRKSRKSANAEWLKAAWKEKGLKPPKDFDEEVEDVEVADAPELSWLEREYLLIFNMVSTCRPVSFGGALPLPSFGGALPLPYTTICEVLDRNGWSGSEFQTAVYVVHQMDQELLRIWDTERERSALKK